MDQGKSQSSTFSDSLIPEEAIGMQNSSTTPDDAVIADAHQSDENGGDGSKKAIWNKPSVAVVAKEVHDVIDTESWPALSESAHSKKKSFSSNSLKTLSYGPSNVSQGIAADLQNEVAGGITVPHPTSSPKHTGYNRQKSVKHGGGGGSSNHSMKQANGSLSQVSHTHGSVTEASGKSSAVVGESSRNNGHKDAGKREASYSGNGMSPQAPLTEVGSFEESPRDNEDKDVGLKEESYAGYGILSQAPHTSNTGKSVFAVGEFSKTNSHKDAGQRGGFHGGNEQRLPYRRSNSGPLHRGDGSFHQNYGNNNYGNNRGGRNQNWNMHSRSFGNRGSHAPQQQREGARPFLQVPSPNAPYISAPQAPVPVQHTFMNPMVYTGLPQQYVFMPEQHGGHVRPFLPIAYQPVVFPTYDPELSLKIVNQIEYYFSEENLCKDWFLKTLMDYEGWIPIQKIANFYKVKKLTQDIHHIWYCLQSSSVVEVQDDKVRVRNDWGRWISGSAGSSALAEQMGAVTLDGRRATAT